SVIKPIQRRADGKRGGKWRALMSPEYLQANGYGNVGQWRASSVASNEPPAAPCKPDGPLRWLTKPSSDFWPTSSAGSGHIPDLKAFNRATLNFELQPPPDGFLTAPDGLPDGLPLKKHR